MRKKQTSVSHSSTDKRQYLTGPQKRMLFRWMLVCEWMDCLLLIFRMYVHRTVPKHQPTPQQARRDTPKPKQKGNRDVDQLSPVDCVTTNAHSSQGESQLYIFEDNEAVIKMFNNSRSPTMRHVSGTHRVALDWLFDRINLDRKIQIKYVDTTNQLAEMLTTGSFARDEWDHPLRLLNFMQFSMFSCSHFFVSRRKQSAMSKRAHVKESSRKYFQRRFGNGKAEGNEFGVKKPPGCRRGQDVCEEVPARTLDIPWPWRRKKVVWEVAMIHMKENGVPSPLRCWNDSKIQVTLLSRVPVLWVEGSWEGRISETPYTSMRMLWTQNSNFERFT